MGTLTEQYDFGLKPDGLKNNKRYFVKVVKQKPKIQDSIRMDEDKSHILVVEDVLLNQQVARILLEQMGYKVDIAGTGQAALDFYKINDYALILMDIGLPDLSGIDATQQIRKFEKSVGKKPIPIIALTANGDIAKTECLAAGMDDFSVKPFEIEKLNQLLKTWIEKSKQSLIKGV